jgi:hypothetical protein
VSAAKKFAADAFEVVSRAAIAVGNLRRPQTPARKGQPSRLQCVCSHAPNRLRRHVQLRFTLVLTRRTALPLVLWPDRPPCRRAGKRRFAISLRKVAQQLTPCGRSPRTRSQARRLPCPTPSRGTFLIRPIRPRFSGVTRTRPRQRASPLESSSQSRSRSFRWLTPSSQHNFTI